MRPYAWQIKCPKWLRVSADDLILFVPMWIGTLALLCLWLGIPVIELIQRIASALTGGV